MNKKKRQAIIKRLILENEISRQSELLHLLEDEGVNATQATVSRDIRELNIVKHHDSQGRSFYRILNNSVLGMKKITDEERLVNAISETGVSLVQIEFINVLTVLPGNGQVIGVLLDSVRSRNTDIVGCVAGDDTILILSSSKEKADQVNKYIQPFLFSE